MSDEAKTRRWSDREVERLIGRLLQVGVVLAAIVVLVGGVVLLAHHGLSPVDFSVSRGDDATRSVGAIVSAVLSGDPRAVVQLGLVILIATPVARVAFTLVAFFFQRDWLYVALTTVVLALLVYGLAWGG